MSLPTWGWQVWEGELILTEPLKTSRHVGLSCPGRPDSVVPVTHCAFDSSVLSASAPGSALPRTEGMRSLLSRKTQRIKREATRTEWSMMGIAGEMPA